MKLFDLHADIGYDLLQHPTKERFNMHIDEMKKGEIALFCMASFFDGHQTYKEMQSMILNARKMACENKLKIVKNSKDFVHNETICCIMSVEGMCGIQTDVIRKINWLYNHDVRLASLTWNDGNALANGVLGNAYEGLTQLGVKVIKHMNKLNMVIDVSHANEATFWDIMRISNRPVIASHSNTRILCGHDRNLSNQMILALIKKQGLIGLNAYHLFIGDQEDAKSLAKHAKIIKDLGGIDHIALGFDYMNYFEGLKKCNDLFRASESQNLINAFYDIGFTTEEIEKIAYLNAEKFFKQNLT